MLRAVLIIALLGETVLIAVAAGTDPHGAAPLLVAFALACACAAVAARAHYRAPLSLPLIVLAALLLRLPLLFTEPNLSDDVWRYLHDGRAQLAGVSPYAHAPADAATEPFRGVGFARINHPHLVTIYPPAAQLFFLANALLGAALFTWKLLLLAAELAIIAGIAGLLRLTGRPPQHVVLYAWHPLAVLEVAGNAHLEPLAIAPLILALLLARRALAAPAGAALAVSIAVKYWAAPLLLAIARGRPRRTIMAAALTLAVLYLPYSFGPAPFGSLATFAGSWASNAVLFPVLVQLAGSRAAALLLAGVVLAAVLAHGWRSRASAEDVSFRFAFATLLVAPVIHPWYLLWLLALLPLSSSRVAMLAAGWWTVTVPAAYTAIAPFAATGDWHVPPAALFVQYAPVAVMLGTVALTTIATRRRARAAVPG